MATFSKVKNPAAVIFTTNCNMKYYLSPLKFKGTKLMVCSNDNELRNDNYFTGILSKFLRFHSPEGPGIYENFGNTPPKKNLIIVP